MRQKSMSTKAPAEKVVRDAKRTNRDSILIVISIPMAAQ